MGRGSGYVARGLSQAADALAQRRQQDEAMAMRKQQMADARTQQEFTNQMAVDRAAQQQQQYAHQMTMQKDRYAKQDEQYAARVELEQQRHGEAMGIQQQIRTENQNRYEALQLEKLRREERDEERYQDRMAQAAIDQENVAIAAEMQQLWRDEDNEAKKKRLLMETERHAAAMAANKVAAEQMEKRIAEMEQDKSDATKSRNLEAVTQSADWIFQMWDKGVLIPGQEGQLIVDHLLREKMKGVSMAEFFDFEEYPGQGMGPGTGMIPGLRVMMDDGKIHKYKAWELLALQAKSKSYKDRHDPSLALDRKLAEYEKLAKLSDAERKIAQQTVVSTEYLDGAIEKLTAFNSDLGTRGPLPEMVEFRLKLWALEAVKKGAKEGTDPELLQRVLAARMQENAGMMDRLVEINNTRAEDIEGGEAGKTKMMNDVWAGYEIYTFKGDLSKLPESMKAPPGTIPAPAEQLTDVSEGVLPPTATDRSRTAKQALPAPGGAVTDAETRAARLQEPMFQQRRRRSQQEKEVNEYKEQLVAEDPNLTVDNLKQIRSQLKAEGLLDTIKIVAIKELIEQVKFEDAGTPMPMAEYGFEGDVGAPGEAGTPGGRIGSKYPDASVEDLKGIREELRAKGEMSEEDKVGFAEAIMDRLMSRMFPPDEVNEAAARRRRELREKRSRAAGNLKKK